MFSRGLRRLGLFTWLCILGFTAPQVGSAIVFPANVTVLFSRGLDGNPNPLTSLVTGDGLHEAPLVRGSWPVVAPNRSGFLYHRDQATIALGNLYRYDFATGVSTLAIQANTYLVGADWTLDSQQVVFDIGCTINMANLDGSNNRVIDNSDCYDDGPATSPINGAIAFHNQYKGLLVMDADGSNRSPIPNTQPNDYLPTWSPDGRSLAFYRDGGVYRIDVDGTGRTNLLAKATTTLTVTSGRNAWSPDGQWIVVGATESGVNGLWAVSADGRGAIQRIPTQPGADINWVGAVLVGDLTQGFAQTVLDLDASAASVDANTPLVINGSFLNRGPGVATHVIVTNSVPNGATVSNPVSSSGTVSVQQDQVVFQLGSVPAGATATFQLTLKASVPGAYAHHAAAGQDTIVAVGSVQEATRRFVVAETVAPYLNGLFYTRYEGGKFGIWFSPANGDADIFVTEGAKPKVSPSHRYLVFERDGDLVNHHGNVYIRDLSTGVEKLATANGDYIVGIDFTGDSESLVYDFGCGLNKIGRDGSGASTVVLVDCYDDAPTVNTATGEVVVHNLQRGLVYFPAKPDGSTDWAGRKVIPNTGAGDFWPSWSPDGKWIAFLNQNNWYRIRPDGTERTQLTFFPTTPPAEPLASGAQPLFGAWGPGTWSGDGRVLLVPGRNYGVDSVLAVDAAGGGGVAVLKSALNASVMSIGSWIGPISRSSLALLLPTDRLAKQAVGVPAFGPTDQRYILDASTDLAHWSPIHTNTIGTNLFGYTILPEGFSKPYEFFRARPQP